MRTVSRRFRPRYTILIPKNWAQNGRLRGPLTTRNRSCAEPSGRSGSSCPQQHPARSMVDVPDPDRRVLVQLVAVDLHATTAGQQLEAVVVRGELRRCPLSGAPGPKEPWRDGSRVSIGRRDRDAPQQVGQQQCRLVPPSHRRARTRGTPHHSRSGPEFSGTQCRRRRNGRPDRRRVSDDRVTRERRQCGRGRWAWHLSWRST